MNKLFIAFPVCLGIFLLGSHCSPDHNHEGTEGHALLLSKIKMQRDIPDYQLELNTPLDTSRLIEVHASLPGIAPFFTEKRIGDLTSYPCSNCHSQSLEVMQANRDPNQRKAHWDIQVVHAKEETMQCVTCHPGDQMDKLASLTGRLLEIDESFKLCGQCHSTQRKDWEGGAHGKELNGWAPPRVAQTCVNCHNPHQPAIPSRFPARYNTRTLGEE